jgi:predicted Zn-dependent protease with MMP-like domain
MMERERFESLVARAVEGLPEEFRQRLENVDVVVEDKPTNAQLVRNQVDSRHILLGLYEGVPLTARLSNYGMVTPDKITIFQKNIEAFFGTDEGRIQTEVGKVVYHEIAHHFGISDARLEELQKDGD